MSGPPVPLGSHAARARSCGTGVLSSLSPLQGCISGSSELGWGLVELLRTSDVRVFFLIALFVLALASTRRFGYSRLGFFSGSPSESGVGCPLLSSRSCDDVLRTLPCSSVGGLNCTGPTNTRQSQWENVISCGGGQVFLVRLGGASSAARTVSYCHRL